MNPSKDISIQDSCFHCGEICKDESVALDSKLFCCSGCKTVYEILNENKLCTYYNLDAHPGISPQIKSSEKYSYLDDSLIIKRLLDFENKAVARVTLFLPQMHCASCVWLLEKLYKLSSGIKSSTVNYPKKEISINFNQSEISLREIVILLSSIGYEPSLSLADAGKRKNSISNKTLYFQIGIAGFCFGNIMLFSMPEYFDLTGDLTKNFKDYFGWINILFALPVLFYSDLDYFKSAIGGLRNRTINLDVPLSLGMITLFLTSVFEIISSAGSGYLDSFTGLVFFLLVGRAFQQKTFQMISFERDYRSYFPLYANLLKNGGTSTIPLENLKVGDRLLVKNEDLVPADGILLSGSAYIDYSFVTGESDPVFKELGEMIYAGGKQIGSSIEIEIIREVSNSYLTELWNNQTFSEKNSRDLKALSNTIGKWFTISVLIIAFISSALWLPEYEQSVKIFAAVLIVACPCALALSIPYTFGNTIRILGAAGFYLKSAQVVESIAKSDFIVFDKTGTLTDTREVEIEYIGESLDFSELNEIKSLSHLSNHPLSRRLSVYLNGEILPVLNYKEDVGFGIMGEINGKKVKIGSSKYVNNGDSDGVFLSINGTVKGKYVFHSKFREAARSMIFSLKNKYDIAICSGDNLKDKSQIDEILPANSKSLFNQSPEDKLNFIQKVKGENHRVIMIGDGLNDAGALQSSDVGISITDNTGHFSPASDVIMDAEVFEKLDKILAFCRYSVKTVKLSFILSAIYNITGLVFAVQGLLTPVFAAILMPLSSVTVVIFTTAMTNIKAKTMNLK